MNKKTLIKSNISIGTYTFFLEQLAQLAHSNKSSYVCVANAHMLIEAHWSQEFNDILQRADIVTPDGMPLALSMKLLYGINQDRVAGMDLISDIFKISEAQNLSVFLLGSTDDVLNAVKSKASKEFPALAITDVYSPPFREPTQKETDELIERINQSNPAFLLVALGCPKQEKWMSTHMGKINTCMVGLGGAFPVYSGLSKRAPRWMQRFSLEWLFRLLQEPRRLWKRYLITNSLFIYLIFKQFISQKLTGIAK